MLRRRQLFDLTDVFETVHDAMDVVIASIAS